MTLRDQLTTVVLASLKEAKPVADKLLIERMEKSLNKSAGARAMVSELPAFKRLTLGSAEKVSVAILFVDMRGSTRRAVELGAHATYLTMHAFLPAMAYLVGHYDGFVVGFRGDGLFAAFGIDETGKSLANTQEAVQSSSLCGEAMLRGNDEVVNPILRDFGVFEGIEIGVGVDFGEVVITKIGLPSANEVTAYGNAVNAASKLADSSFGAVLMSPTASNYYPSGSDGRATIAPTDWTSQTFALNLPFNLLDF